MNLHFNKAKYVLFLFALGLAIGGCQKMSRPVLKELLLDPPPPPYSDLKDMWAFEDNLNDNGENKLTATSNAVTYVPGINGKAAHFGTGGYILLKAITDTILYPNGFKGVPGDTLKALGSVTLAFWMNVPGPVQGGAQGLFSISNSTQFWGNLDLFLENLGSAPNPDTAWLKIHMFNASAATADNEQWITPKVPAALNKWTHIAVTYDAITSKLNVYSDGVAVVQDQVLAGGKYGPLKYDNFNGVVLGNYQFQTNPTLTNHGPEGWASAIKGDLDQVRIYNRALSASEVMDLFTTKN